MIFFCVKIAHIKVLKMNINDIFVLNVNDINVCKYWK